eukprot:TRINITY_DN6089_c0_g1_i1.p1 TRINITY_DN6089_c0_g1~~TRINITY_DN6089_c0_g1_i1.p1  ORF type:complete len:293 (-),score=31.18 TRINITY_DN6089_c0_g1_i1:507-1277(-)
MASGFVYELVFQSFQSFGLMFGADLVAQGFKQICPADGRKSDVWNVDLYRSTRMAVLNMAFQGITQYWWYCLLEEWFPGETPKAVTLKLIIDNTTYNPVSNYAIMYYNTYWEPPLVPSHDCSRHDQAMARCRYSFFPTWWVALAMWIPGDIILFTVVGIRYRVLFYNALNAAYLIYFSLQANAELPEDEVLALEQHGADGLKHHKEWRVCGSWQWVDTFLQWFGSEPRRPGFRARKASHGAQNPPVSPGSPSDAIL